MSLCHLHNNFNPRSPCGERLTWSTERSSTGTFQSTLPVRGATIASRYNVENTENFNPRSPCGERPGSSSGSISTKPFQSTLPVRGATEFKTPRVIDNFISIHAPRAGSDENDIALFLRMNISIHAPRAGSDLVALTSVASVTHFNPRSPCGERPVRAPSWAVTSTFQSTLPVRGATEDVQG